MLTKGVVLLVVLATALAGKVPFLDIEEFEQWNGRIVGGQTAAPGQFPYQASLRTFGNFHFCGATIVSSRWVISAAHCTENDTPNTVRVIVGAHNRIVGGITMAVSRVVNHPQWSRALINNDISMVQTELFILFSPTVQPIGIGTTAEIGGGVAAVASGWGQTSVCSIDFLDSNEWLI